MDKIITVDALQQALEGMPSNAFVELCQRSGVPYSTAHKIRVGETRTPGFDTVSRLLAAMSPKLRRTVSA